MKTPHEDIKIKISRRSRIRQESVVHALVSRVRKASKKKKGKGKKKKQAVLYETGNKKKNPKPDFFIIFLGEDWKISSF